MRLLEGVAEFQKRERRYGGLDQAITPVVVAKSS